MKEETKILLDKYLTAERELLNHLDELEIGKMEECSCDVCEDTIAMPDEEERVVYKYCLICGGWVAP